MNKSSLSMKLERRLTLSSDRPEFIQFFPTMDCNRKCSFCFNRGYTSVPGVSIEDYAKLIEVISGSGIREIDILGGEPTLHPDIVSLVDIPVRRGMRVFLSTNGSNAGVLNRLAGSYGTGALSVGVSVHGEISGELHDFIVRHSPVLKSVCAEEMAVPESAAGYLKSGKRYCLLYRDAVVRDDLTNCMPFHKYVRELKALKAEYRNVEGVYCQGFIPADGLLFHDSVRCPAGTTKLTVLPDGSAYPCYLFIRNREFRLGNMLRDDFSEIWRSPVLAFFREFRKNACPELTCDLHSSCRGGCPAASLLICGDLNAPDPRCVSK